MIRTKNVKYIHNPTDRDEFYDLQADPQEMRNIIDQADPQLLRGLQARLYEHINETRDPLRSWSRNLA